MKKKKEKLILSEVVDSPKSAQEFMDMNKIKKATIVIIWNDFFEVNK